MLNRPTNTQTPMSPRTHRFMRELDPSHGNDPDERFWRRVSAVLSAGVLIALVGLLAIIGLYAPPAVAQVSGPGACGVRAVESS